MCDLRAVFERYTLEAFFSLYTLHWNRSIKLYLDTFARRIAHTHMCAHCAPQHTVLVCS